MKELSKREAEVIRGVAAGLPDKAIALELGISVYTVRTYIERITEKLPPGEATPRHRLMLFFFSTDPE